jgi:large conductance mechanosensitive channel
MITPLIPAGNTSLGGLAFKAYTGKQVLVGPFIEAVISFLILALVIYFFIVKPVNALMARFKPKEVEAPPTTRDCPYCLSSVPLNATRCAYCTSPLPPPGQAAQPIPPAQQ